MTRQLNTAALLLALAGCAATPNQLMQQKEPNTYTSAQAPKAVANCIARNQLQSGGVPMAITDAPDGNVEVTGANPQYRLTEFYALISPGADGGSTIKAWTQSPYLRDTIERGLLKGC